MHSLSVLSAIAFVITCLSNFALGVRKPVDELYQRKRWETKSELTKRDLICVYDDILLSFETFEEDAAPFCSSYIRIPKATSVSTTTTATTIVAYTTTTLTANQVVTVPIDTVTTTITQAPAPTELRKRQITAGIIPASEIIASCTDAPSGLNLTLINDVSSACSCLQLPTSTVTETTISTSTRTLKGVDNVFATLLSTVTSGEKTVTITVIPVATIVSTIAASPLASASITPSALVNSTLPTSPIILPSVVNSTLSPSGGNGVASSAGILTPTSSTGSFTIPPFGGETATPRNGGFPDSATVSTLPTTSVSTLPALSITSIVSSAVPLFSANATAGISGSSGLLTSIISSSPSGISSGFASAPSNGSAVSAPLTSLTSASAVPTASINGTSVSVSAPASASGSAIPSAPFNSTLDNTCPAANGTLYVTQGQTYMVLCNTNYIGPSDQGLIVPNVYSCIEDCAITNLGFSQSRCFAASYIPNNNIGTDCFLRTENSTHSPEFDPKAISGLLLNNTLIAPVWNVSSSVLASGSAAPSSTQASFSSSVSANTTTSPLSASISLNVTAAFFPTSIPSLIASVSANITSVPPSLLPSISTNLTSTPSVLASVSANITSGSPPGFSGFPTGSQATRTIPLSSADPSPTLCAEGITVTAPATTETVTSFGTLTVTVASG